MDENLIKAQKHLRIQSVNLTTSTINVKEDIEFALLDRSKTMTQGFRYVLRVKEITLKDDNKIWDYRFMYEIGLRLIFSEDEEISKEDDDFEPIFGIISNFEAKYFSDVKLDDKELKAYSAHNVGYHVWPYWREYVQSSCTRIGLSPVLEVPVYIIPNKEEKIKKKTKKKAIKS
ncbi:MAG: hypothetical protein OEW99_06215 [Gammaproteobacteria bacterium]|nr:hypothetical protein [Gammaproteobacteria bacterium]